MKHHPTKEKTNQKWFNLWKCQQVTGTENSLWTSSIQPPKTSWNKSINIIDSGASSVLQRWRDDKLFPIKWSLSLWPQCESRLDSIKDSFKSKPLSFISDLHWMSGRLFFFLFFGNISQTLMKRTWRWVLSEKAIHRFNRRKPNQWRIDTRRHLVGYLEIAGEGDGRVF